MNKFEDSMQKIAQRRSLWNKVRPSNITRQIGKLNPQYRDEYNKLVAADDAIRNVRSDGQTVKDLLKELKINNKNHRWLAVLDRAAKINSYVSDIINLPEVLDLQRGRAENIRDFYFTQEDDSGKYIDPSHINRIVASEADKEMIKQALFGGLSRRITDKLLSSFYDKKEREIRRIMQGLANRAETLAVRMMEAYKSLDAARATGKVSDYIHILDNLKREQESFQNIFRTSYDSIKDYIPKEPQKHIEQEQPKEPEEQIKQEEQQITQEQLAPVQEFTPEIQFGDQGLLGNVENDITIETIEPVQPKSVPPQPPAWTPSWQKGQQEGVYTSVKDTDNRINLDEVIKTDFDKMLTAEQIYERDAKKAIANGDYGIAVAVLSKYSQHLEDIGNIDASAKILAIAMDLFSNE